MKICLLVLLALAAVAVALPVEDDNMQDNTLQNVFPEDVQDVFPEDVHFRVRRASCDLFSGFGPNHSICAGHCILKKYHGGYCNSRGVCVCRN
uniref:Defensin1 n=1 Tax=Odontomachus monticola TaxID=613454 RepID=A0A348G6A8_ODOMO